MKVVLQKASILFIFTALLVTGCDSGGNDGPAPVVGELAEDIPGDISTVEQTRSPVENIPANPSTVTQPRTPVANIEGDVESNPGYTFFDLDAGAVVEDSASDAWDIGFGGTTLIANSGNEGGIQVISGAYADVEEAPADGYEAETAQSSWYNYDFTSHQVTPKEDQTIVVETPDGNYAKIEILSYYRDSNTENESRYFTFNYTLKTNGETALYHEDTYTYYDLEAGEIIEDAASSDWDVAFDGTTVMANDANGGGIQVVAGAYAEVEEAPESGYAAATAQSSWYNYDFATHVITPKEDQTIVVHTPEGNYGKIQVLSYYEDGEPTNDSRYYTFNYLVKTTGETQLYHESEPTYFDLESGEIVQDATSPQWDIAFSGTTIAANAENNGGIQSLNIAFADVDEAPVEGYAATNAEWYNYTGNTPPTHAVLPVEGVTLVVQTPDGNYAKVRIISYYEGNPDTSSEEFITDRPDPRYFTFEYAVQTDGSVYFE
ncbi:HmuY family protein [Gracilimonas mengyeensis]|uniref:HmuY protein n=1 Tax=Gracilimonas mengyeensis TaxID=1302730 RepID=A0A521FK79_9BACT|nr:HmuY family protein [Gracilimonas mengyeensis]SMO96536.1 hypothetical protein SAMN06265219_12111 [Gracilimonas mengyeensis]